MIKYVRDFENRSDVTLLTGGAAIEAMKAEKVDGAQEYGFVFVVVGDAEIMEMWAGYGIVPLLSKRVYPVVLDAEPNPSQKIAWEAQKYILDGEAELRLLGYKDGSVKMIVELTTTGFVSNGVEKYIDRPLPDEYDYVSGDAPDCIVPREPKATNDV